MDKIFLMTTVGSEQQAIDIAQTLVQKKLAACVSYSMRFHSIYWWEGKVCSDQEVLLMIKSVKKHETAIIEQISKIHQYEIPEILSFNVDNVSEKYLQWIDSILT